MHLQCGQEFPEKIFHLIFFILMFLNLLTAFSSLTQIEEHPIGASMELLLSTTLGRISSMCRRKSCEIETIENKN